MTTAPLKGKERQENVWLPAPAAPGDPVELDKVRAIYDREAEPVGSVPPPSGIMGVVKTGPRMGLGGNPTVFIDKLGERLAFERTGSRLFELLITKLQSGASPAGPVDVEVLRRFREQEMRHFHSLWECLENLGADPTVQTPSADLAGVKGLGLIQIMSDPRASFAQSLDAMLIAEHADNDGWRLLIALAEGLGQKDMSETFRAALLEEDVHLATIRDWWARLNLEEAGVEKELDNLP
ncbi:MAG TPA: ferritin-like domain-containing protein [Fibrobacteria bacterium]|nr:ferritin-like domain-containing protein [Fibrobacteria bacterium]